MPNDSHDSKPERAQQSNDWRTKNPKKLTREQRVLREARDANFSPEFVSYMENRVLVGFFNYGSAKENAAKGDFPAAVLERVEKYKQTGNTEWLVDAANFCMLEFMYPQHTMPHFRSTSADESPGVPTRSGGRYRGGQK